MNQIGDYINEDPFGEIENDSVGKSLNDTFVNKSEERFQPYEKDGAANVTDASLINKTSLRRHGSSRRYGNERRRKVKNLIPQPNIDQDEEGILQPDKDAKALIQKNLYKTNSTIFMKNETSKVENEIEVISEEEQNRTIENALSVNMSLIGDDLIHNAMNLSKSIPGNENIDINNTVIEKNETLSNSTEQNYSNENSSISDNSTMIVVDSQTFIVSPTTVSNEKPNIEITSIFKSDPILTAYITTPIMTFKRSSLHTPYLSISPSHPLDPTEKQTKIEPSLPGFSGTLEQLVSPTISIISPTTMLLQTPQISCDPTIPPTEQPIHPPTETYRTTIIPTSKVLQSSEVIVFSKPVSTIIISQSSLVFSRTREITATTSLIPSKSLLVELPISSISEPSEISFSLSTTQAFTSSLEISPSQHTIPFSEISSNPTIECSPSESATNDVTKQLVLSATQEIELADFPEEASKSSILKKPKRTSQNIPKREDIRDDDLEDFLIPKITSSPIPVISPSISPIPADDFIDDFPIVPLPTMKPVMTKEKPKAKTKPPKMPIDADEPLWDGIDSDKVKYDTKREPIKPCAGPNTQRTAIGKCVCKEGYPFGNPDDVYGCWKCASVCVANSKCVFPGICQCENGFRGNGSKKCTAVLPKVIGISPRVVFSDETTLVNISVISDQTMPTTGYCKFGEIIVTASMISENLYQCSAPPRSPKSVSVSLSFDAINWSEGDLSVEYKKRLSLLTILPYVILSTSALSILVYVIICEIERRKKNSLNKEDAVPFLSASSGKKKGAFPRKRDIPL